MANSAEDTLDLVVSARNDASDCVVALELRRPDGGPLPTWTPGSHIDLILGEDLVRQYSLCGDAHDKETYRIGVLLERDGRGGSARVHGALHVGTSVAVRGPRNKFELEPADGYVFIAGGVGITPILAMVQQCDENRVAWRLHYGGRSISTMAFTDEVVALGDHVSVWPEDERGLLDLASIIAQARPEELIYCCGPSALLARVEALCAEAGMSGRLRVERFSSSPVDTSNDGTFEVEVSPGGQVVQVSGEESILDALERVGIDAAYSCRDGVCGTCQVRLLDGVADHRDDVLSEAEKESQDRMQICVSRAVSRRLVIEL